MPSQEHMNLRLSAVSPAARGESRLRYRAGVGGKDLSEQSPGDAIRARPLPQDHKIIINPLFCLRYIGFDFFYHLHLKISKYTSIFLPKLPAFI